MSKGPLLHNPYFWALIAFTLIMLGIGARMIAKDFDVHNLIYGLLVIVALISFVMTFLILSL